MPLTKIHIRKGHPPEKKRAIADAVQASLIATLDIPEQDRFQLIHEYEDEHFIHTDAFLDLTYTRDLLMIEIAFIEGRSDDLKKALLADLNRRLAETTDVRSDDVFVAMYDIGAANVSFGRGLAQRAR
jgi:phenylpyruvate tautomerase PptA (4-oxalocrotonate tautomerase family)